MLHYFFLGVGEFNLAHELSAQNSGGAEKPENRVGKISQIVIMNNLSKFELHKLHEMNDLELKRLDGGTFWIQVATLTIAACAGLYSLGKDIGKTWAMMEKQ